MIYIEGLAWLTPERCSLPLPDGVLNQERSRGIVTGGQCCHWQCLAAHALAAHEHHLGLAVADHGLAAWQREELARVGVYWIDHQKPGLDTPAGEHAANDPWLQVWWKPWICLASPFQRSLWVDADAVLVGDPAEAFDSDKPMIGPYPQWERGQEKQYIGLIRKLFAPVYEEQERDACRICAGILAWTKGEPWLAEYAAWTLVLLLTPSLYQLSVFRDQSAAAMSILARLQANRPPVLRLDARFNIQTERLPGECGRERLPVPGVPAEFYRIVRERHPGVIIAHYLGFPKPWELVIEPGQ